MSSLHNQEKNIENLKYFVKEACAFAKHPSNAVAQRSTDPNAKACVTVVANPFVPEGKSVAPGSFTGLIEFIGSKRLHGNAEKSENESPFLNSKLN